MATNGQQKTLLPWRWTLPCERDTYRYWVTICAVSSSMSQGGTMSRGGDAIGSVITPCEPSRYRPWRKIFFRRPYDLHRGNTAPVEIMICQLYSSTGLGVYTYCLKSYASTRLQLLSSELSVPNVVWHCHPENCTYQVTSFILRSNRNFRIPHLLINLQADPSNASSVTPAYYSEIFIEYPLANMKFLTAFWILAGLGLDNPI
jgi:hypothetical protein